MTIAHANHAVGTEGELVVFATRKKLLFIAATSLAFIGLMFWISPGEDDTSLNAWKYRFAVLVGIPFFTLTFMYATFRLLSRTPLLIANQNGLFLAGTALGPGWLAWHEVDELRITGVRGQAFMSVTLTDERAVMSRLNILVRALAAMNKLITGCPFHVPQSVLPMPVETLMREVEAQRLTARV